MINDFQLPFKIGDTVYLVESTYPYSKTKKLEYKVVKYKVEGILIDDDYDVYPVENTWDGYVPAAETYYNTLNNKMEDSPIFTTLHEANNFIKNMELVEENSKLRF